MSRRTLFLIFALFLITFVLLMIALFQPQSPKATPIKPVAKESVAQTVLSFGVPVIATSSSTSVLNYSLPVNIISGKNKVTVVQLELQYDPLVLTDVAITPSSFFPKPDVLLNQIDTKTGRISYALSVGLTGEGIIDKGTVANLAFSVKAQAPTKTIIIFLPKTLVAAAGINESVLKQAVNTPFTVGGKPFTPSAQ